MTWLYSIGVVILIFVGLFVYIKLLGFLGKIITERVVDNPNKLDYLAHELIIMFLSIIIPLLIWCIHEIFFRKWV